MELILDTGTDCFLCLKPLPPARPSSLPGWNERCLRSICRFLQIDPSAVLLQGLKEEEKDVSSLHGTRCNFSVTLCDPCNSVAGRLSSLIQELEVVQLKVNYYSGLFHRILEDADVRNAAVKKEPPSSADARVVDHLRRKAKLKCAARQEMLTSSLVPVVQVERLKLERVASPKEYVLVPSMTLGDPADKDNCDSDASYSPSSNSSFNSECSETSSREDESVAGTSGRTTEPPSIFRDLPTPPKLKQERADIPSSKGVPDDNSVGVTMKERIEDALTKHFTRTLDNPYLHHCGFCSEILLDKRTKFHLTCRHPEKLLSFAKHPSTAEDTFLELCLQALNHEIKKCKNPPASDDGKYVIPCDRPHICSLCRSTTSDRRYMKDHLVTFHSDVLRERLDHLQKERDQLKIWSRDNSNPGAEGRTVTAEAVITPEECPSNTAKKMEGVLLQIVKDNYRQLESGGQYVCNSCGETVKTRTLKCHVTTKHCDKLLAFGRIVPVREAVFQRLCLEVVEKEMELCKVVPVDRSEGKWVQRARSPHICYICSRISSDRRYLKEHLVMHHADILQDKVDTLLNETEQPPEGSDPETRALYNLKRKGDEGVDPLGSSRRRKKRKTLYRCLHCPKITHTKARLNSHLLGSHPEELFLAFRPPHQSAPQFAGSCQTIFERETEDYNAQTYRSLETHKCAYCACCHRYKKDYLYHLVFTHTEIMGEKIRALEGPDKEVGQWEGPTSKISRENLSKKGGR